MTDRAPEYLEAYGEFSKVLRTWFVAYGIGAPVLLLTSEKLSGAIQGSGTARTIAASFLAGVVIQVALAAANKFAMWGIYYGETNEEFKGKLRFKIAFWFSEAFWIDFLADLATMGLFGWATWRVFNVVLVE